MQSQKKNWVLKNLGPKKFWFEKRFGLIKNFGLKKEKLCLKKFWGLGSEKKNLGSKKNCGSKKFWSKNFGSENNLGLKKCWVKKKLLLFLFFLCHGSLTP